jgi:hypothetical protein
MSIQMVPGARARMIMNVEIGYTTDCEGGW